jgi:SAM-dependent methyltransferase
MLKSDGFSKSMNTQLLINKAVTPYFAADKFGRHFAKGKLICDPMFVALLKLGLIPDAKRLLDLGCGQGILASWLLSAQEMYQAGQWLDSWAAPPVIDKIEGIDLMPRDIERAKQALGQRASFSVGDVRTADFGKADVLMLLDVLHYLTFQEQEKLLHKIRDSLTEGGVFITRVGDRAAGLPCLYSQWVDLVASFIRGHRLPKLYCRSVLQWQMLLTEIGFSIQAFPMSDGTLFSNTLLVSKLK